MPIAFTQQEQENIREQLFQAALLRVQKERVREITVRALVQDAGISVGAFYKFYPNKEQLFYDLLRKLHHKVYGPAMEELMASSPATPAQRLRNAIVSGCQALEDSGMERFWTEDTAEVLAHIPECNRVDQRAIEMQVFRLFFSQNGTLRVGEKMAIDALRALIQTVNQRKAYGENYPDILLWMAEGVCNQIFV